MLPIVVLKFGSSVLRSAADFPLVVDEVYRRLREGVRVIAVVSAFAGETDRLFARAREILGEDAAPSAVATFVATGELQSAALLTGSLCRAGIAARMSDPRDIGFTVEGDLLEADPVGIDRGAIEAFFVDHTVLVLPGFFGMDAHGRLALLGRGGSDLSALFLAGELGSECHLVKDVPGVFDRDPALDVRSARRYAVIPWAVAAKVAGPLIQPKALAQAARSRTPFTVSCANGALETRIADETVPRWGPTEKPRVRLRVVLLGCGVVGCGVYERLVADVTHTEIVAVVTRHPEELIRRGVPATLASDDLGQALRGDVDVVIEALSDVEPAASVIAAALSEGKRVISANKAAITARWAKLGGYLREPERRLWIGATVGGAVPVLETLARLQGRVRAVRGVINGTCNYVLEELASDRSFDEAVRGAQAAGFAESDPERDLSGRDAADKLSLIAYAAFGTYIPTTSIPIRGIDGAMGDARGGVWRSIGSATRVGSDVTLGVAPERIARDSFLGRTVGAENRVEIVLEDGTTVRLVGQGAGRAPTSLAVMGDVHEVLRR